MSSKDDGQFLDNRRHRTHPKHSWPLLPRALGHLDASGGPSPKSSRLESNTQHTTYCQAARGTGLYCDRSPLWSRSCSRLSALTQGTICRRTLSFLFPKHAVHASRAALAQYWKTTLKHRHLLVTISTAWPRIRRRLPQSSVISVPMTRPPPPPADVESEISPLPGGWAPKARVKDNK